MVGLHESVVYHGTPHTFAAEPGFPHGRFRLDKIGTGEGAQAYGWGIYFAEEKDVAKSYVYNKPPQRYVNVSGRKIGGGFREEKSDMELKACYILIDTGGDFWRARKWVEKTYNDPKPFLRELSRLEKLKAHVMVGTPSGSLYALDIPYDTIPKMLLWDESLSKQGGAIREKIQSILEEIINKEPDYHKASMLSRLKIDFENTDGGKMYKEISELIGGDEQSSKIFGECGVPGLRFFDQVSRSRGDGTYNYVIWDQKTLDRIVLLARNEETLDSMLDAKENGEL